MAALTSTLPAATPPACRSTDRPTVLSEGEHRVLTLCGALLAVGVILAVLGIVAGSGFVYASLIVVLVAAALLPVGVLRRLPTS
ncbi:hypothetical protein FAIPA1_20063 [Frankia sp. AiPs1]